jgi:D-cysteine desulfhydrase
VFASSSGGRKRAGRRQKHGYAGQVLGISVDVQREELQAMVAALATATAAHLKLDLRFAPGEIAVNADYIGAGYGVLGTLERQAIRLAAEVEGLLLDPVYTLVHLEG